MKLKIIGSGSKANSYILISNTNEMLVLEAGVSLDELLKNINYDVVNISCVLVSHEHSDHAGYLKQYDDRCLTIAASKGTLEYYNCHKTIIMNPLQSYKFGNFIVVPFPVQHDAAEPYGFLIYHKECGKLLFATDTYYIKYKFNELNNIMIECNYDENILNKNILSGKIHSTHKDRLLQSHMSYQNCLKTILSNDLTLVNNIILIHLSDSNSDTYAFKRGIELGTGKNVYVANRMDEIEINCLPF